MREYTLIIATVNLLWPKVLEVVVFTVLIHKPAAYATHTSLHQCYCKALPNDALQLVHNIYVVNDL